MSEATLCISQLCLIGKGCVQLSFEVLAISDLFKFKMLLL